MTQITFSDSGMSFGPFDDAVFFYIEKSNTYANIQQDVKMAEFLLLKPSSSKKHLLVVEAKSSSPNPNNEQDFSTFIDEIKAKFYNAFILSLSMIHNRHASIPSELPSAFKSLNLEKTNFRLVLIINGHKTEWLPPIQDILDLQLKPLIKTWSISGPAVLVLNELLAKEQSLIS